MEYYSDYLAHSSRKGSQRKNHKYTARQWVNGRWRYVYGKAKNAVGYAYGSKYREDMDKYGDALERSWANQIDAINSTSKRSSEYYDKEHAMGERYMDKKHSAADAYYKSAAYKVDKATGRYAKDEANRYLREGGSKQGDYYVRNMLKYNDSISGKAEKASNAAKSTIEKGRQAIANLFKKKK